MQPIESHANNKRIVKNTIILYIRMAFTMAVQLYTSRIVLAALGVSDYGVYNVVGGIVTMFAFLNSAMTTSTQRYITYELGKKNPQRLKQVFATSMQIHFLIALVVIVLAESVGIWFLKEKMIIAPDRTNAAMWVFQLSVITVVVAIMSFPYNAAIIAHEKMSAFAYISVLEVSLKLAAVYFVLYAECDKLILYAILIASIQLLLRGVYSVYCKRHFAETRMYLKKDKILFKEMLSFAGWNLWGNFAAVLFTQGQNMLLNVFFGPVVNAARGIAVQVQGAILQFAGNFQMAVTPQITKTYANNEIDEMHSLILRGCKFTFYLLFIVSLPILLETGTILEIWLKDVPEYTVVFLRIILVTAMLDATAGPLMNAVAATGRVKAYQTIVGGTLLVIVPISYVVLRFGGAPWSVFIVHFAVCCVAYVVRLVMVKKMIGLSIRRFIVEVALKVFCVTFLSLILVMLVKNALYDFTYKWIAMVLISILISSLNCFVFGLSKGERFFVMKRIPFFRNKV